MVSWVGELVSRAFGALGQGNPVALLSLLFVTILTEAGVPFPFVIDSVLFLSSFKMGTVTPQLGLTVLVIFIGRQIGASIVYWLTRLVGITLTAWINRFFPKVNRKLQGIISKLHDTSIFGIALTRLTGLLTLVSIASGLIGIRYFYLLIGVALSSLIFDGVLVVSGIIAGSRLQLYGYVPTTPVIIGICVLIVVVVVAIQLIIRKYKSR